MAQKKVVIKKYENRRLYDTTNSRYVNLEEVAQMLQQGNEVQVIDAAGEDITRLILTQIIVEDAKTADSDFPLDLLRQMVVASGRASQETAMLYMKAMRDFYQSTYRAMTPPLSPFDFMAGLRQKPQAAGPPEAAGAETVREPGAPTGPPETDEVKELKNRLAELEKIVSGHVPGQAKQGRTAKR
jgi:polyhydroxyalkanoate synthesis repressor PhaR